MPIKSLLGAKRRRFTVALLGQGWFRPIDGLMTLALISFLGLLTT